MTLDLLRDNMFAVVVDDGPFAGQAVHGYVDLSILLRNLAVAGALERAFELGLEFSEGPRGEGWECNTEVWPAPTRLKPSDWVKQWELGVLGPDASWLIP